MKTIPLVAAADGSTRQVRAQRDRQEDRGQRSEGGMMVGRPTKETLVGLSFCIAAGAPTGSPLQAYCRTHLPEKTERD